VKRASITLALLPRADHVLIVDWNIVTGTPGVLAKAQQLFDFENALTRLSATNFYISSELIDHMRHRLTTTPHR